MSVNVHEILPQRPPFVFVDEILECSASRAVTLFCPTEGHPLVFAGHLTMGGVVETMAQSSAMLGANEHIGRHRGVIAVVKDLEIALQPCVGQSVTTEVSLLQDIFGMRLVRAVMSSGDEVMARGTLKLMVKSI